MGDRTESSWLKEEEGSNTAEHGLLVPFAREKIGEFIDQLFGATHTHWSGDYAPKLRLD